MRDRRLASRRAFVAMGLPAAAALGLSHELGELDGSPPPPSMSLRPPDKGPIDVAFLISNGATVIDFAGPWEVFQDVMIPARGASHEEQMPFRLYTVADGRDPVRATGGMQIVPDYSVADAPPPRVVVIPAMRRTPAVLEWLRKTAASADLIMSVCTGAFVLAEAGLLAGKKATTHHDFHDRFAAQYPNVTLERGLRFVESGRNLATAGGLTSGIDLALRVVERYFGRETARRTAEYMEYQGKGWLPPTG